MNHERNQQPVRRFIHSRLFLLILLGVAILVSFNYARVYYQDYGSKEIRQLEEDVKNLEQKKLESLNILQYVTSKSFVEEKARIELNMKKPGEQVLIVETLEHLPSEENTAIPTTEDLTEKSNPIKWWYYFVKKSGS